MPADFLDEITLELAAIEREAIRAVRERMAREQLGECFEGVENP